MNKYTIYAIVIVLVVLGIWVIKGGTKPESPADMYITNTPEATENTLTQPVPPVPSESSDPKTEKTITNLDEKKVMQATLHTTEGDITIEFFEKDAPKTVANFLKLAGEGYYDGVKFHRVIADFMIQTGDPNSKDDSKMALWGKGGPGYTVPAEIKLKNTAGTVATARLGDQFNPERASSGSQFFINAKDNPFLDGGYTVFGKVVAGMEVVAKIENTPTGQYDKPVTPKVIKSITLK